MRPSLGVFLAYFVVGARAACQIWCNEWTCEDNNGGGLRTDCRDCPLCAPPPAPPSPPFGPGMCANTYKECGNNGIGPCCVKRTDACMRRANHRFAMCRPVNSPPCVSTDTWVCPDEFLASPPPPPRPPWPPIPPSPPPPPPCSDKYGICTQSQVACPCSNASIGCHPRKPAAGPAHDPQIHPVHPRSTLVISVQCCTAWDFACYMKKDWSMAQCRPQRINHGLYTLKYYVEGRERFACAEDSASQWLCPNWRHSPAPPPLPPTVPPPPSPPRPAPPDLMANVPCSEAWDTCWGALPGQTFGAGVAPLLCCLADQSGRPFRCMRRAPSKQCTPLAPD